ncbi:hypothetical protein BASA83_010510 [Batrachochytrium salamandrivorans]|nr:hypothetical protein BASA81_012315 [Batrachochytrium salamandrivorans]KAH9266526.1 hypothetical protein BASA83_010510 [Batrachochytrium salamandrivorans]
MKLAFFAIVSLLSFTSSVTAVVNVAAMANKFEGMSKGSKSQNTYTGSKPRIIRQRTKTKTTTEPFTLPTKIPEPPESRLHFHDGTTGEELKKAQSVFSEESQVYNLFEQSRQELQRLEKEEENLKADLIKLESKLGGAEKGLMDELEKIEKQIKLKQDAGLRTHVLEGVKKRVEAQLQSINKDCSADERRCGGVKNRLQDVWAKIENVKQDLDDLMSVAKQTADSEEEDNA